MAFLAGQKVRASDLAAESSAVTMGYATADTTVVSSTTQVNATGVAVAVEANATYAWDAYLAYNANEAADIKFAWTVPAGATGHWSVLGIDHTQNIDTGRGQVSAFRTTNYGDSQAAAASGLDTEDGTMVAFARGYLVTAGTAGTFQLRFAQNSSNATASVVKAGSWVRLVRLA
jgi:hypothetical protein